MLQLEGGLKLHRNPTEQAETYAGIYRKAHPEWEGWKWIDRGQKPPFELVESFYYDNFYKPFEKVKDEKVKSLLFETAVNLGVKQTVKLLQKVLGVKTDGILGVITLQALDSVPEEDFIRDFTLARIAFYTALANKNPKRYALYLRGWVNRALEAMSWVS
ncbi:putative peptidoglycan-binding domain-containing protein [Desulfurobacterium crinifex]